MNVQKTLVLVALAVLSGAASAEILRCSGGTVNEGDSRLSVAQKCGDPLRQDSFCRPVEYRVAQAYSNRDNATLILPACEQIDEWLYDRGAGNLMAKVRFRWAVVDSIVYSRFPN